MAGDVTMIQLVLRYFWSNRLQDDQKQSLRLITVSAPQLVKVLLFRPKLLKWLAVLFS